MANSPSFNIIRWIKSSYTKKVSASGLAIFRILFSMVLFLEIFQLFYFRHLVYDVIPFLEHFEMDVKVPMILWMITVVLLIVGLFTRIAAIINYIFLLFFFSTAKTYNYDMFYIYLAIGFLFMFLPISRTYSLDRLRLKLKYSNTRTLYTPPATVGQLAYYLPVLVGLGFYYLDATFFNLGSPAWRSGLGLWKPASLPFVTHVNASSILNIQLLVKGLGYLFLAFQLAFIFLFHFKKIRILLVILGIFFHLLLFFLFPFPLLSLGLISIYTLLVPAGCWDRLFKSKSTKPALTIFYDAECPLCNRTKVIISHLDTNKISFKSVQQFAQTEEALKKVAPEELLVNVYSVSANGRVFNGIDTYVQVLNEIWWAKPLSWILRIPGFYHLAKKIYGFISRNRTRERCTEENCGYTAPTHPVVDSELKIFKTITIQDIKMKLAVFGIMILILFQLVTLYTTPLFEQLRSKTHIDEKKSGQIVLKLAGSLSEISGKFFGIANHDDLRESNFSGYTHIVAVTYTDAKGNEIFLPFTRATGQPGSYLYGYLWRKWNNNLVTPSVDMRHLAKGLRNFTAFWANRNSKSLYDLKFKVKVKKIRQVDAWEKDFLIEQMNAPWIEAGELTWKDMEYSTNLKDINTL